jgi:hypothetical protein
VIGVGLVAHAYGLETAGVTFSIAVALLVLAVLVSQLREPTPPKP